MFCASVVLQELIVRLLAWKRSVFRENSVPPRDLSRKLRKRNASGLGAGGVIIDGIRAKVLQP